MIIGLSLAIVGSPSPCEPVRPDEEVLAVVMASAPELEDEVILGRAFISEAAPFPLAPEARAQMALRAEAGLDERRARVETAREMLERAEASFAELEDRAALDLVAEATPLLVASQPAPEAIELLARAHLLAGAIFVARSHVDAASRRLRRALDIDPHIAPPANFRLLGALEAVRAQESRRARGSLSVSLGETSTSAVVYLDGRVVGRAPGRFDDVPAGRHLIRVSAPERRSYLGAVLVEPGRTTELDVHLAVDEVQARLRGLGRRLATGQQIRMAQEELTQRANVGRSLVAAVVPSRSRGRAEELVAALVVDLERAGRARVDPLTLPEAKRVLTALADCKLMDADGELTAAPAYAAPAPPAATRPGPTPEPRPAWREPWFWALAAVAAVGLAGSAAIAQGAAAAPDSAAVTLVPRP